MKRKIGILMRQRGAARLLVTLAVAIPLLGQDPYPVNSVAYFDSSSCPTGWARFTQAQGRTIVNQDASAGIATAVGAALGNGAEVTHTHTVSDSVNLGNTNYLLVAAGCCNNSLASGGAKTFRSTTSGRSANIPYVQLLTCIKQDAPSSGFIPRGATVFYAGFSCPTDWSPVESSKGRFLVGLPRDAGSASNFGGGASLVPGEERSHRHSFSGSLNVPSQNILAAGGSPGASGYGKSGRYNYSGSSSAAGSGLPYLQLLQCQKDAAGPPVIDSVRNGASFDSGAIAPGQLISIFGSNLGPQEGSGTQTDSDGYVTTRNSDVQVRIDGRLAPLFFVREDQINAQVPYRVDGTSVTIEVIYQDVRSEALRVPVATSSPGIFAYNNLADAVVLHADGSVVSAANPMAPGATVVLYATGEGLTTPQGVDGKPATAPLPAPILPVRVFVGGREAAIEYAGAAPGFVGLMQVNLRLAANTPLGAVEISLQVGQGESQRNLQTYVGR